MRKFYTFKDGASKRFITMNEALDIATSKEKSNQCKLSYRERTIIKEFAFGASNDIVARMHFVSPSLISKTKKEIACKILKYKNVISEKVCSESSDPKTEYEANEISNGVKEFMLSEAIRNYLIKNYKVSNPNVIIENKEVTITFDLEENE